MDNKTNYAIVNGTLIPENEAKLSIHDLSIVRGYGIFDYFKTVNNKPVFLEDNLDRFFISAALMDLPINYSRDQIKSLIQELIAKNNIPDSGIKILLTGGNSADGYSIADPNFIITQQPLTRNRKLEENGIKLLPFNYHRPFSQVKSIDYVMGIQALKIAKQQGADDVVYALNGNISECPRANFFLVSADGKILTAGDDVLAGITRKKIIELLNNKYPIEIRTITLDDAAQAVEAFVTSTTKNITPITELVGYKVYGTEAGPVTKELQALLEELVY